MQHAAEPGLGRVQQTNVRPVKSINTLYSNTLSQTLTFNHLSLPSFPCFCVCVLLCDVTFPSSRLFFLNSTAFSSDSCSWVVLDRLRTNPRKRERASDGECAESTTPLSQSSACRGTSAMSSSSPSSESLRSALREVSLARSSFSPDPKASVTPRLADNPPVPADAGRREPERRPKAVLH